MITYFPKYQFGDYVTPRHNWFAWRPVKMWWGSWVWLKTVSRRRVSKHSYLDGPDWEFWAYSGRE